jgi:uncharacterized protein YrrD
MFGDIHLFILPGRRLSYNSYIMLKLSNSFEGIRVLSLRSGGPIATVVSAIINPNNLAIVGFHCLESPRDKQTKVLLTQDIREWVPQGFAVNDHDALSVPADLVRLKSIMEINYQVIGKSVHTQSKTRMGKVSDYAFDDGSFRIQKIYVQQSIVKNISGTGFAVDRDQIVEINDRRVIIRDPLQGVPQTALASA